MSTPASAPSEMAFFSLLARCGSFSGAARELDVTTPAVSKRLAQMEARLGVQLLNRTTRRVSLTPEGEIEVPHDLTQHNCIGIRQGYEAYGVWRLSTGKRTEAVKVRGNLSTSDGEIAVNWALDGHGILMRAEWDIAKYLRSGRLVQVLENYRTPPADIHAVYPQRHQLSGRVR